MVLKRRHVGELDIPRKFGSVVMEKGGKDKMDAPCEQ